MKYLLILLSGIFLFTSCRNTFSNGEKTRERVDTVGYASRAWQMDSIMARIKRIQKKEYQSHLKFENTGAAKVVICPHDDYSYVGYLYPATLSNIKAKTVLIFGVAHKAKKLNLENQLIFDSYDYWEAPYGKVRVSKMRNEIMKKLPENIYQVNDTMQAIEHSVEAIVPFLQYFNRDVQIISVLVPYMSFARMKEISLMLSKAIDETLNGEGLKWGDDFAMVISSDAVHYGDEDWGGKNFAFFGVSCTSYVDTKAHELDIMQTIAGRITPGKIKRFTQYTVDDYDYKKYKWTWCGRYSVPLGLLTANYLKEMRDGTALRGRVIGYTSSYKNMPLPVKDLNMDVTAPAYDHHWVGYAAIRYD